ncbi:MAG: efflux RND transporter periplasmic adaptor subunit [Planctomycetes bacterium]|nr:efflux RND transporter periplasmic adaptor subunit [Planctomycetota bacterium]
MKALTEKIIHYLVLAAVTFFAFGVMWKLSVKEHLREKQAIIPIRSLPAVAAPKSPVAITPVQVQTCEILFTYAGKIQPWETYQIGFPLTGRVVSLGTNGTGAPLDDGDRVQAGQVLATIDDRVFRAQKSEAAAQIEKVTSDLQRAQRVRQTNRSAVSDSELQKFVTDLALARAQHEVAVKNLDDATLRSPVDATISKRMVKSGESVSPNQIAFELVVNKDVLLVVDVPETRIRELEERMRAVAIAAADSNPKEANPQDAVFRAYVRLEGRDRFGNAWPPLEGEVYRIPEVADSRTGLFAVEIKLSNAERLLRPGMVATADIVTARIAGYKIPEAAVIFRQRNAFLFTVDREPTEMEMLYWNIGPTDLYRARRVDLDQWIDQGEFIIVPQTETQLQSVITRGQFRLADQQFVRIVNLAELSPGLMTQMSEKPLKTITEH